jgi:hypothetical protein
MSDNVNLFLARGAECVGGDLILKNKTLGRFRDGEFQITDEGRAELDVEEVEFKEVVEPAPKPKRLKKADVEPPVEQTLDELLGPTE